MPVSATLETTAPELASSTKSLPSLEPTTTCGPTTMGAVWICEEPASKVQTIPPSNSTDCTVVEVTKAWVAEKAGMLTLA